MRTSTFGGTVALTLLLGLSAASPGCGGGGGGGGGPCTIPGTLVALAVSAAPAADIAGNYGPFGPNTRAATADNGWTVFVADTTSLATPKGLFVAQPNGTVRLVFGKGENLPSLPGGSGTVNDFERMFVTSSGVVVALADAVGATSGRCILTARVDGTGTVVEKYGAMYLGTTLPARPLGGAPGALTDVDPNVIDVDEQGTTFFAGTGTTGGPIHGIYSVDRAGGALSAWVATGDALPDDALTPDGVCGSAFQALGIDADGTRLAFSVNIIGGTHSGLGGIFATDFSTFVPVARDTDALPDYPPRTLAVAYAGLSLAVFHTTSPATTFVTWTGQMNGGSPNLGVFTRQVELLLYGIQSILAAGQTASVFGPGALLGDTLLLPSEHQANRVTIQASIIGSATTDRVYFASGGPGNNLEIFQQGEGAPGGALFTDTYPSLATNNVHHADNVGSMAFTALLSDATTGVFWAVSGCGFFAIAKAGTTAPGTGGGTFGGFNAPTLVTTATGVVVFRADISGGSGPTGLFRQG